MHLEDYLPRRAYEPRAHLEQDAHHESFTGRSESAEFEVLLEVVDNATSAAAAVARITIREAWHRTHV